ncbi:protein cbr-exc-5 [Anaeramoeba flamelloides]|uniref:Protein cbr-exc-5 n=1 Tax=Anaeramoeba flamelloides TaxID=1746091 RepID=A0AAV8AFF7_9EUKA|nr:protein cbr-exc-5 [Anaeramoeba flamelloides]
MLNLSDFDSETSSDDFEIINEETTPTKDDRFHICKTFLVKEQKYAYNLDLFLKNFFSLFKDGTNNNRFEFGFFVEQLEKIFFVVKKMLISSSNLIHNLEFKILVWNYKSDIGDLLVSNKSELKHYLTYLQTIKEATNLFLKCRKNDDFNRFVIKSEKEQQIRFEELFQKPVSYMHSHRDLIKKFLEFTDQNSSDYKILTNYLQTIEDMFQEAKKKTLSNKNERQIQQQTILENLEKKFVGKVPIVQKDRRLIYEGSVMKISRRRSQKRYLILLNDLLLVSSPHTVRKNKLSLHRMINLEQLKITDLPDTVDSKNSFSFQSVGKSFTVYTEDSKTKQKWIQLLNQEILHMRQLKNIRDEDVSEAPIWQRDSETKNCPICTLKFNVRRRKHHCRSCGNIVCAKCSPYKFLLSHVSNKPVRVSNNIKNNKIKESKKKKKKNNNKILNQTTIQDENTPKFDNQEKILKKKKNIKLVDQEQKNETKTNINNENTSRIDRESTKENTEINYSRSKNNTNKKNDYDDDNDNNDDDDNEDINTKKKENNALINDLFSELQSTQRNETFKENGMVQLEEIFQTSQQTKEQNSFEILQPDVEILPGLFQSGYMNSTNYKNQTNLTKNQLKKNNQPIMSVGNLINFGFESDSEDEDSGLNDDDEYKKEKKHDILINEIEVEDNFLTFLPFELYDHELNHLNDPYSETNSDYSSNSNLSSSEDVND